LNRPPHTIARSWLLVPAHDTDKVTAAFDSAADVVILDLEDGVPDKDKPAARSSATQWLVDHPAWLRINDCRSPHVHDDLVAAAGAASLQGILVPKSETTEQIEHIAARLGAEMPLMALVESARGVAAAPAIAATASVTRLAFGSGDYRRDTGTADTPLAQAYPRSQLVLASRIADIAGPVNGPTLTADLDELRRSATHSLEMGMTGQLCLNPEHAVVINEALSPTPDDIVWAADTIARLGVDGEHVTDGSDPPQLAKALKIRSLAVQLSKTAV
jgi:citrate lyase subunit beta/citryl-CoA lyase